MSSEQPPAAPTLEELIDLLVAGNDPVRGYRGTFTVVEDGALVRERRIWRLRDLARVEDASGRGMTVAGDRKVWYFPGGERPRDFGGIPAEVEGLLLDPREYWTTWLSKAPARVTSTLRPVVHENRSCWQFSAPEVKGGSPTITVDAELGLVVRAAREDLGSWEVWSDVEVDPSLEVGFFVPTEADRALPSQPRGTSYDDVDPEVVVQRATENLRLYGAVAEALADPRAVLDVLLGVDAEAERNDPGEDDETAAAALQERFGFDRLQAHAVLDLQLRRVTPVQRARIAAYCDDLRAELAHAKRRPATP
ncbi:hypothetical protein [Pimelobacter simplex]|uniref:hypothetical protein n=1 Tax=Nocardioides simplex TaxID=2045 RepID=UPI003AACC147